MEPITEPGLQEEQPEWDTSWLEDFWLQKPYYDDEFAGEVCDRWESHFKDLETSGMLTRWTKSYKCFHGLSASSTTGLGTTMGIASMGEQGEFSEVEANIYRTLVKTVLNLGTSGRPSFSAVPINNDYRSSQQVRLTDDAIAYYQSVKRSERRLKTVAETSLVLGSAFIHQYWDPHDGNGQGDVREHVLSPFDVAHEQVSDLEDAGWWIVRVWQNKYDLAALYPDKGAEILAITDEPSALLKWRLTSTVHAGAEDQAPVFYFYARRSPACPDGRLAILVGDAVLLDGPLPYEECPVFPMQPSTFLGSAHGYSDAWDVLALHDLFTGTLSALGTRLTSFAVPNIVTPEGSQVGVMDLGGAKLIRYPDGSQPPSLLELFNVPPALFQSMEMIRALMQGALGINSVVGGGDQGQVKSGSHAALLQAMALQFQSGFQASWAFLLERWATGLVRLLKRFVTEERIVQLAGEQGAHRALAFKGESFSEIDRVRIDLGNPMARTIAGRYDMAKDLLQANLVKTPEQFLDAISTGRLDPITEGPSSHIELVKAENQALLAGQPAPVLMLDRHDLHVSEHLVLLNHPRARANQELVRIVNQHVNEHMQMWTKLSTEAPHMLAATGTVPLPIQAPPQAPPGPGGPGSSPGNANPEGSPNQPPKAQVETPLGGVENLPRLPKEAAPPPGSAPLPS